MSCVDWLVIGVVVVCCVGRSGSDAASRAPPTPTPTGAGSARAHRRDRKTCWARSLALSHTHNTPRPLCAGPIVLTPTATPLLFLHHRPHVPNTTSHQLPHLLCISAQFDPLGDR